MGKMLKVRESFKKYLFVLVSILSFCLIYYLLKNTAHNIVSNLIIFAIIVINMLLFAVDEYEDRILTKRYELAIRLKELEHQKENVEQIKSRHLEIEKRNHDFDKAVMMLQDLLSQKKYDEAEKLVNSLRQSNQKYVQHGIYSTNVILNTLLNRKLEQCRETGIDSKCFVCGRVEGIDEVDLYYMFANLIDNAISAAQESGEPYISIFINCSETRIYGEIANSIPYTEKMRFDEMVPDAFNAGHGYGLGNIRDIVAKNGGKIEYDIVNPRLVRVTFEMVKNIADGGDFHGSAEM